MITQEVQGVLSYCNGARPNVGVPVVFTYSEDDPYAVIMSFQTGDDSQVPWTVSRELVMMGTVSPRVVGSGDVKLRYEGAAMGTVAICLSSPEGHAHVRVPQKQLVDFVNRTQDACPPGKERSGDALDEFLAEVFRP